MPVEGMLRPWSNYGEGSGFRIIRSANCADLDYKEPKPKKKYIPPMNHPWRKSIFHKFVQKLEKEKAERARSVMARFPALKIGKYGQLMEWMQDYEEAEPGHRHISHLYGVYPGSSVTWERTPELMKAARVSLERRLANGGGHTGWSRAWIIGLWARFKDGRKSYENLKAILSMGTYPNLMDNHPVGEHEFALGFVELLFVVTDGQYPFFHDNPFPETGRRARVLPTPAAPSVCVTHLFS